MTNKICCILNYAPHYRQAIFTLMDKELNCDFYFGSKLQTVIKKIDYNQLNNVRELKTIWFFNKIYWMQNMLSIIFKSYKKYLMTGQINCINNWLFIPLARLTGKKVYLWNHGWYGKETWFERIIKKIYYWPVNGFFLYGEYARGLMMAEGFNPNKLHVVYNSLDYQESLRLRQSLKKSDIFYEHFGNSKPVLIFSGRLQPIKKLDMLLNLLKIQKEKGVIYNLVLIGDGADHERLRNIAVEYKIESQVWFYGPSYNEEKLSELIYNADICVSPGNVGLTAIHSLSYGTPVITHNDFDLQMPEFEGKIPEKTGAFYKANDLKSLGYEIENWLTIHHVKDEGLIQDCYKIIDNKYNPDYQFQVLKKVLKGN